MNKVFKRTIFACLALLWSNLVFCAQIKPSESLLTSCTEEDVPKIKQEMTDVTVQVKQATTISVADAFSGKHIHYSISAKVTAPANQVIINRRNGIVIIKAEKVDEFPVTVTATAPCGTESVTFNVTVTEP